MLRAFLILLLTAGIGAASPFLVADPVLATDPTAPITGYVITGLPGSPITTPAQFNAATSTTAASYQLMFDMSAIPAGKYTVTAAAQNQEFNASGVLTTVTGVASAPLTFTLPIPAVTPSAPTNLLLHK